MMKPYILAMSAAFALAGCIENQGVAQADYDGSISSLTMLCNSHYPLTQDCSNWSGATRKLTIEGFRVNAASTADGKTILIMDPTGFAKSAVNYFGVLNKVQSTAANNSFEAVQKVLLSNGVAINRVRPLTSINSIEGYVLELSKDGYSSLIPFTTK